MTGVDPLRHQVADILNRAQVSFTTSEDGSNYGVVRGSAAVLISFNEAVGVPVVSLGSPVLMDVPLGDNYWNALAKINDLNAKSYFAKFILHRDEGGQTGTVRLEHDLLGGQLQDEEFLNTLDLFSQMADNADDVLQNQFGGKSFEQETQGTGDT
jgi:hypothetical protein